jgi:hypothetical protein
MRTLSLILVLFSVCALLGCKTYYYKFTTVIDENGGVEREIHFYTYDENNEMETAPNGEEELPEPGPFLKNMVLPERHRFDVYEVSQGRLRGGWHSAGEIHTDFRYQLITSEGEPVKDAQGNIRYAFNDGEVIVQDFALLKVITYVERFYDYFTKDELDTNLNTVTDILVDLTLATIKSDLGKTYRLKEFNKYVEEVIVPFLKKWNSVMFQALFVEDIVFDRKAIGFQSEEQLKVAYDLKKLGITENVHFAGNAMFGDCQDWLLGKMHELVVSKKDGRRMSIKEIEHYFSINGQFQKSFKRLIAKKYGSTESFEASVESLFSTFSFSTDGFLDSHVFEHSLSLPGTPVHVYPEPENAVDFVRTRTEEITVKWEFGKEDFFPDGVVLMATMVIPLEENQKKLFGKIILEDPKDMEEYLTKVLSLRRSERDPLFEGLHQYIEEGSVEKLVAFFKREDDHPDDIDEIGEIGEIFEYFEETEMESLLDKALEEGE